MAGNVEIAEFGPSDGLTPQQVRKLNWNFRRLAGAGGVSSSQSRYAPETSGSYLDLDDLPSIEGVELAGNKDFPELGIFVEPEEEHPASDDYALTSTEITALWNAVQA